MNGFLAKNPFVKIIPWFLIGLLVGLKVKLILSLFLFLLILFFIFYLLLLIFTKSNTYIVLKSFIVYLFFLIFGIAYGNIHKPIPPSYVPDDENYFIGTIVEPSKKKTKTVQTVLQVEAYADSVNDSTIVSWKKYNAKILVYMPSDSANKISYGDKIIFYAKLDTLRDNGNPCEFSYKNFLAKKGIFLRSYITDFQIINSNCANVLFFYAIKIRNYLLEIYKKYNITGDRYAILSALTLGYKDEISYQLRKNFADTGAMHVLAVSGLHVGIIYLILNFLLKFMERNKKLQVIKPLIIIFFLWVFAFISGLSPSVVRAALMFSLFAFSTVIQRPYFIFNSIAVSVYIILLFNPLVIYSVGFQLSYAAVLSIVIFQPGIYKLLIFKNKILDSLWSLSAVSIAAQIGTMPIGLYYFHQFPNYFFLTNLIVIPLASIILYSAVALLILSPINFLAKIIAYLLKFFLDILIKCISVVNSLPYSATKGLFINLPEMLFLYILVILFFSFLITKRKQLLLWFLGTLGVFLILLLIFKPKENYREIWILNVPKSSVVNVIDYNTSILLADTSFLYNTNKIERTLSCFWQKRKINTNLYIDINETVIDNSEFWQIVKINNLLKIFNKKFLIVHDGSMFNYYSTVDMQVDYVLIVGNPYFHIEQLQNYYQFDTLIFTPSSYVSNIRRWKSECENLQIPYYDVGKSGAMHIIIR